MIHFYYFQPNGEMVFYIHVNLSVPNTCQINSYSMFSNSDLTETVSLTKILKAAALFRESTTESAHLKHLIFC